MKKLALFLLCFVFIQGCAKELVDEDVTTSLSEFITTLTYAARALLLEKGYDITPYALWDYLGNLSNDDLMDLKDAIDHGDEETAMAKLQAFLYEGGYIQQRYLEELSNENTTVESVERNITYLSTTWGEAEILSPLKFTKDSIFWLFISKNRYQRHPAELRAVIDAPAGWHFNKAVDSEGKHFDVDVTPFGIWNLILPLSKFYTHSFAVTLGIDYLTSHRKTGFDITFIGEDESFVLQVPYYYVQGFVNAAQAKGLVYEYEVNEVDSE